MGLMERIKGKRLIIYGTGNTGTNFYQTNRLKLDLKLCTSSDKIINPIEGLDGIERTELNKETDFVIICSIYHQEITNRLSFEGWEEGVNYLCHDKFIKRYDAESGHKIIMVVIGQCHLDRIRQAFGNLSVSERYAVWFFNEREVCVSGDMFDYFKVRECVDILRQADILLKPSVVTSSRIKDLEYFEECLPKKCRIISFSLPMLESYWPQDRGKESAIGKYYVTHKNIKIPAYVERDHVIEKYIDEGKTTAEIIKYISDDKFFSREEVINNHQQTLKRGYFQDRLSEVKITDYIEENYNKKRLFYDRGHFGEDVLKVYLTRLLKSLGEPEQRQEIDALDLKKYFNINEAPIYPSTAQILNLEFANDGSLLQMYLVDGARMVTFTEYMEWMIEYYKAAKRALECSYVN